MHMIVLLGMPYPLDNAVISFVPELYRLFNFSCPYVYTSTKAELDRKFKQVRKNDIITVMYYEKGEYLKWYPVTLKYRKNRAETRELKVHGVEVLLEEGISVDEEEQPAAIDGYWSRELTDLH